MNTARDKFLTEAMGECWHESTTYSGTVGCASIWCPKCKKLFNKTNFIDFSIWKGFGKLWEWAQGQEWWSIFWDLIARQPNPAEWFIHPDRFADAVHKFLTKDK